MLRVNKTARVSDSNGSIGCSHLAIGSKVMTAAHTILAALASIRIKGPVKVVLSRQQVLTNVGHRMETVQRFELGATRDGKLVSMRHHT